MYDAFLYKLEQENKKGVTSGKGDEAKKLIDKIEYLQYYQTKEIEAHKEFLDDMANVRNKMIELGKELKALVE